MSRYEKRLKMKEIKRLVKINQYYKALKIMETIDLKRIKDISELNIFAEIYTQNERYDDAMNMLLRVYERSDTRKVLCQLIEVSLKCKAYNEVEQFYEEYCKSAPSSPNKFILRYKIDKVKGASTMSLIHSLEELKSFEYEEKWAFELAKLYHRAGLIDKCVKECNDIILWFGSGVYVERAQVLKYYYISHTDKSDTLQSANVNLSKDGLEDKDTKDIAVDSNKESNNLEENLMNEKECFIKNIPTKEENNIGLLDETIFATEKEITKQKEITKESISKEYEAVSTEDDMEFLCNLLANDTINEEIEINNSSECLLENERNLVTEIKRENEVFVREDIESEVLKSQNNSLGMEAENGSIEEKDKFVEQEMESIEEENKSIEQENESIEQENESIEQENESIEVEKKSVETKNETMDYQNQIMNLAENKESIDDMERLDNFYKEKDIIINGVNINTIFKNFFHINELKEEICRYIDILISKENSVNHFIITGYNKSGKTELGKMIAYLQYKFKILNTSKVAKISASKLNQTNLNRNKTKLMDGCLVIENASELTETKIKEVIQLIKDSEERISVILEGQKNLIANLLEKYPELNDYFTNRIYIPVYGRKELVDFAYEYLIKKEYKIDSEAQNIIMDISKKISDDCDDDCKVEKMIEKLDDAILRADARNEDMLKEMIKRGTLKKDICIIKVNDFIHK